MANAAGVLIGVGKFYGGVTGTALPTNASSSLNAAFKDLGLISDAGVDMTVGQNTNEIKAWDGSTVRKVQTSHTVEFHFVMLETNPASVAAFFGAANFDDTTNTILVNSTMNARQEWVMHIIDGVNIIRVVIPDGEVTGHGNVIYKNDQAIGYEITITAYADTSGNKAYEYLTTAEIS